MPSRQPAGTPALLNLVRFCRQACNTNSGVAFVSDVEPNQERGDLLQDARGLQLAAVNRTYARNLRSQSSYFLGGVGVVAADDHVAVDRSIGIQKFG